MKNPRVEKKPKASRSLKSATSGEKSFVQRTLLMRRKKEVVTEDSDLEFGNTMGALELASISAEQRRQYKSYLEAFKLFCKDQNLGWPVEGEWEIDVTLSDFFDDLFLAGKSSATGEKTLAAVEFMFLQHKGKLMRARRSLKGWRKIDPPRSRLPLPRVVACGIAAILLAKGQRKMALKVMTDFDCYLRPGEGMDILGKHVVKPLRNAGRQFQRYSLVIRDQEEGVPDKTGTFDNTLLLDNPLTKNWLGPALAKLAQTSGRPVRFSTSSPTNFGWNSKKRARPWV